MRTFILAVVALVASGICSAAQNKFFNPCASSGQVEFVPNEPRAGGPLGIKVDYPAYLGFLHEWVKVDSGPLGTYTVDVLLIESPDAPAYGYTSTRFGDQVDGYLGSLAEGTYTFTASVRVVRSDGSMEDVCGGAATTLLNLPSPKAPAATVPVVEFFNATLGHYFMSADPVEIQALDTGVHSGWARTGYSFPAYVPAGTPTSSGTAKSLARSAGVSRYYGSPSAGLDSHFFSVDAYEEGAMARPGSMLASSWELETTDAFQIFQAQSGSGDCPAAPTLTLPVYRLWNGRADSNHRYTTDLLVRQQMIDQGWVPEGYGPMGIVMCAPAEAAR
jgi:hypothetical protein